MSDFVLNPGFYQLKSLLIGSIVGIPSKEFKVDAIDISNLIPSISITTSIEETTVMGSFKVIDSIGIMEKFPLRGEERAKIVLMDSLETELTLDVFCYKIDGVEVSDQNGVLSYIVSFISTQSFMANRFLLIKSFREQTVSSIARDIFDEYFKVPEEKEFKSIIIYPETDRNIRCTIPKLRPDEAMQFLSKRAFSSQSPSSSFRFFENLRNYYFASDETLFDVANQNNRIFTFTFYDAMPKDPSYFKQRMDNLSTLVNSKRVNTIDDMLNGTYRNRIHVLDILNGTVNLREPGYNYSESKGAYFRTESKNVRDRHTQTFIDTYFNEENQKTFLSVKDYMDEDTNPDASITGNMYLKEIGSNRLAFRKHINSISVDATGPGRFDITAGDIVELDIKEFNSVKEKKQPEKNEQLSGKYIVRSVSYEMERDAAVNRYSLIKREWSSTDSETDIGNIDLEGFVRNIIDG